MHFGEQQDDQHPLINRRLANIALAPHSQVNFGRLGCTISTEFGPAHFEDFFQPVRGYPHCLLEAANLVFI